MEIVFARTRWHYDSYTDFWKLVELSGFPTVYIDEMDVEDKEKTYIVSPCNGELPEFMASRVDRRRAEILVWNLERPSGSGGLHQYIRDNNSLKERGYVAGILVSDRALSRCTRFHYVTLGSHPELGTPGNVVEKEYDLIHLSCYSNHRSWLFRSPAVPYDHIGDLMIAPNAWGEQRHQYLQKSRIMLNVHQDGLPYLEPLRFALATAYGLPIVSENITDSYPYTRGTILTGSGLLSFVRSMIAKYDHWCQDAQIMRSIMTGTLSFRNCVEMI